MTYFTERVTLIENNYSSKVDTVSLYKDLIEKKYKNRPEDFYEGQQFFCEFRKISLTLQIQLNSIVMDLSSLELRNVGSKFREIYGLMRTILQFVTQRANYFYSRYNREKERYIHQTGTYCKQCGSSIMIQNIMCKNKGFKEIFLINTLDYVKQDYQQLPQKQQNHQHLQFSTDKKNYLLSLKASQAVSKLNQIIEDAEAKIRRYTSIHYEQKAIPLPVIIPIFQQQRNKLKGIIESRKRSTLLNVPQIIVESGVKTDQKQTQTSKWEFDHTKETLILQKQAVMRTLMLQRQRSQEYLNSMRKSRSLIQDLQKQLLKFTQKNKYLQLRFQNLQKQIAPYKNVILQLQQKCSEISATYQLQKQQKVKLRKQLANHQLMNNNLNIKIEEVKKQNKKLKKEQILQNTISVQTQTQNTLDKFTFLKTRNQKIENNASALSTNHFLTYEKSQIYSMRKMRMTTDIDASPTQNPFASIKHSSKPSLVAIENKNIDSKKSIINLSEQEQLKSNITIMKNQSNISSFKANLNDNLTSSIKNSSLIQKSFVNKRLSIKNNKIAKTSETQVSQFLASSKSKQTISKSQKYKKYYFRTINNSPSIQSRSNSKQKTTDLSQNINVKRTSKNIFKKQRNTHVLRDKISKNQTTVTFNIKQYPDINEQFQGANIRSKQSKNEMHVEQLSRSRIIKLQQKQNVKTLLNQDNAIKRIDTDKYQSLNQKQSSSNKVRSRLKLDIKSLFKGPRKTHQSWLSDLQNLFQNSFSVENQKGSSRNISNLISIIKQYQYFSKHYSDKITHLKSWLSRMFTPSKQEKISEMDYLGIIIKFYFAHQKCDKAISSDLPCYHIQDFRKLMFGGSKTNPMNSGL